MMDKIIQLVEVVKTTDVGLVTVLVVGLGFLVLILALAK